MHLSGMALVCAVVEPALEEAEDCVFSGGDWGHADNRTEPAINSRVYAFGRITTSVERMVSLSLVKVQLHDQATN